MKINCWKWALLKDNEKEKILSRSDIDISSVTESVNKIIEKVKTEKDKALYKYTKQFDKADISSFPLKVSEEEFTKAENSLDKQLKKAIAFSIKNVKVFHKKQYPEDIKLFEISPGIFTGERFTPIDSTGLYVPRGRGSFPSMLYMLAVPAKVAGVKRICIVTPPNPDGSVDPACLYAAKLIGINEVYRVGGAQAIAALTFGTESIKPVVKITGPGSAYVTAAKRILYGKIDVGLPAGPSESVVLADNSADPYKVALDLLIEAEHGSDSAGILVTDSQKLADNVITYIEKIIKDIPQPRKTFLTDVFSGYGGIILAADIKEAAEIVNIYAPEHLQIAAKNPEKILQLITNAGEILLGQNTPFSIANYTTGPNAVLPTGGMAKTYSPVGVRDFMKSSSIIKADEKGLQNVSSYVTSIAEYEGFPSHAAAIKLRKQ